MRLFQKTKDGGPKSSVDAYFLFEFKSICSVGLLKFNKGGREEFHSHAFNALTWFLFGDMTEEKINGDKLKYRRNFSPKFTPRENIHRVFANKTSWCLTIRGPWISIWCEYYKKGDNYIKTVLTNGRRVISKSVVSYK